MNKNIKKSLTEDIIKKSALLYDTPFDAIKTIGGFENFVFEYNKNGKDYILRFVHSSHRSKEQVYGELEFIDYLDKNNSPVSTIVHSVNDKLLEIIDIDNDNYFIICVFEKAPGGLLKKEDLTDEFYEMFGEEVGILHNLTKSFIPTHKRIEWDEETFLDSAYKYLPKSDEIIIEKYKNLLNRIKKLPKNLNNFGLIHTDLHMGNMFISSGKLTFFDWDDSAYKHFISDIAIILFYHFIYQPVSQDVVDTQSSRILALLLKGYRKQNSIDFKFLENLNDFLMLRTIVLYFVIYDSGEELIDSNWGKHYIERFRNSIINNKPYLTLEKVLRNL